METIQTNNNERYNNNETKKLLISFEKQSKFWNEYQEAMNRYILELAIFFSSHISDRDNLEKNIGIKLSPLSVDDFDDEVIPENLKNIIKSTRAKGVELINELKIYLERFKVSDQNIVLIINKYMKSIIDESGDKASKIMSAILNNKIKKSK